MTTDRQRPPGFVPGLSEDGQMVTGPPGAAAGTREADSATTYLREIRNWMRFIGIVVIINVVAAIVIGIVVGVEVSHAVSNTTSGGTTSNSNCMSQGGTDPSC